MVSIAQDDDNENNSLQGRYVAFLEWATLERPNQAKQLDRCIQQGRHDDLRRVIRLSAMEKQGTSTTMATTIAAKYRYISISIVEFKFNLTYSSQPSSFNNEKRVQFLEVLRAFVKGIPFTIASISKFLGGFCKGYTLYKSPRNCDKPCSSSMLRIDCLQFWIPTRPSDEKSDYTMWKTTAK